MALKNVFVVVTICGIILPIFLYTRFTDSWTDSNIIPDMKRIQHLDNQFNSMNKPHSKDINIVKYEPLKHNFEKGIIKFNGKHIMIFIHDRGDLISDNIRTSGIWEGQWMNQFVRYIKQNPGIQVIDAGCNLGVYTLMAASMGAHVFAIDANKNNTDRLSQSVMQSNFTDTVTIFLNALSNERKTFSMHIEPTNIGRQALLENKNNTYQVQSILLDDLLPYIDNKQDVLMKMDIEGYEIASMKAAGNLFDKINIKLVFIEWVFVQNLRDSYSIMNFFLSRNYKAYLDFFMKNPLDISCYKKWPIEIVWRKD